MKIDIRFDPSRRNKQGLSAISLTEPESGTSYELDLGLDALHRRYGAPDAHAQDLLTIASICYIVDRIVRRRSAPDAWTRTLEVEIPVSSPSAWRRAGPSLRAALNFLTGDVWTLSFVGAESPLYEKPPEATFRRRRTSDTPLDAVTSVCLFSGGLDSLAGAIDLLAADPSQRVLLIGHYDAAGPRSQQLGLLPALTSAYPGRVDLVQIRACHTPSAATETTLRSRSLVFLALGLYAARVFGSEVPLFAPENGLIAVNLPLTPSRIGSCSTRTMHPYFLSRLRAALRDAGINNPLTNPFEFRTKGECVRESLNRPLVELLANLSVSCSHAGRRQRWVRKGAANCGYCIPCLFRRAALHRAGLDDGLRYGLDVFAGELRINDVNESGADARALLDFLRTDRTVDDIARGIRAAAPVEPLGQYAEVVARGFDEVRKLIADKGRALLTRAGHS